MNGLTKEAYLKAEPELKDEMMFDCLLNIHERLEKIERRKLLYSGTSFIGGIIGGIVAVLGKGLLKS